MTGFEPSEVVSKLVRAMRVPKPPTPLFALIDAARDPRIYEALKDVGEDARCLFRGALPPVLAKAAPYLIRFRLDFPFGFLFSKYGWGHSWGVPLQSAKSMDALFQHFRRLLTVSGPEGQRLLFRFYDPRVLRLYLPTCTPEELKAVFGPVDVYYVEPVESESGRAFYREGGRLDSLPTGQPEVEGDRAHLKT